MKRAILPLSFAVLVTASGCSSTGVGNPYEQPTGTTSLAMLADDTEEPQAAEPDQTLPAGSVEKAILVVNSFTWVPCDAVQGGAQVVPGPFVVNLLERTVDPPIPAVSLTVPVCELRAWLGPARNDASLAGRSILFAGKRADGVPWLLFIDLPGTLRIPIQGAGITSQGNAQLLWAFRPRRWMRRSDLETATPRLWNGQPYVLVEIDHPLLLAAIRANIAGRSTLHRDLDQNGQLDSEDRSAVIGLGAPGL